MAEFSSERITERLLRIRCPGNVYAYLALGDSAAALIDTGFGYGSLKEYVQALTDKELIVLLTHGHYDHSGGAGEFERCFVPEEDIPMALEHSRKECRRQGLAGYGIMPADDEMPDALRVDQIIGIREGFEIDLGSYTVHMTAMHGHTPGMMCPLFMQDRIILFGDALNSLVFLQLEECSSVEEYRDSLKAFRETYEDLYDTPVYSHPHNFGGKEILDEMIDLCSDILQPGYQPAWTEVAVLAKETDQNHRNTDGTAANLLFRRDRIQKK